MKKTFWLITMIGLCFVLCCTMILSSCDNSEDVSAPICQHRDEDDDALCDKCSEAYTDGIDVIISSVGLQFKTLTVTDNNVYGTVSNSTTQFSFVNEVMTVGDAKYVVLKNANDSNPIFSKAIDLDVGDNTVYIVELIDDEPANIYTVVIRRRPQYKVKFDSKGGTAVQSVIVEEDTVLTAPTVTRAGYTFVSWDYDFAMPITKNTEIKAQWSANTNTAYKIEYYLEKEDRTGYELFRTDNLIGTTDTTVTINTTFDHFTLQTEYDCTSGNINGDGTLVLRAYYTRDTHNISCNDPSAGSVSNLGAQACGKQVTLTATPYLGYQFLGYYAGNKLLSAEATYTVTVDKNIEAKFGVAPEMQHFYFSSTATACQITAVKNKNLQEITVPNYVTAIDHGVFKGCNNLVSITLPFLGGSLNGASNAHFAYIFGANSVADNGNYVPASLTTVVITGGTSISSYAFSDCSGLETIAIPEDVVSIGLGAFQNCSGLSKVVISNIAAWCKISFGSTDANPLYYAKRLYVGENEVTDLVIPDSVTSISSYAFYNCNGLETITISEGVTSISFHAFYNCTGLKSVIIPSSVTSIDYCAFNNCTGLRSVYYGGTKSQWSAIVIGVPDTGLTSATRYYYSVTEPVTAGNYWHYNENGEVTVW